MSPLVKRLLLVLGHLVIVALCAVSALMFVGGHTRTDHTINGRLVASMSQAELSEALKDGKKLMVTDRISLFGRIVTIEDSIPLLILPLTPFVIALLWVYIPGVFWRPLRHIGARSALVAVPVAAVLLAV